MGSRIIDQPKSSAMLAYGTSRGFRLNTRLLALVAGSLVFAGVIVFLLLRSSIPLPEHTLLLIAARPSALNKTISPTLQRDLPAAWREAIGSKSHFPVLFGIAIGQNRQAHAFAIAPKTAFLSDAPGLSRASHGLYHLVSATPLPTEATPLQKLPIAAHAAFGQDATFFLRADILEAWALNLPFQPNPDAMVRGTWDDGVGVLDMPHIEDTSDTNVDASLFAVMNGSFDAHRPITTGLLSQGVDLRAITAPPTITSLSVSPLGNRALTLAWSAPLSDADRAVLALAHRDIALQPTTLPDGTGASTFFPASLSSIENNRITFFETVTTTPETVPPFSATNCPGAPRFVLEGDALLATIDAFSFPSSWQNLLNTVRIHETNTGVMLCVK